MKETELAQKFVEYYQEFDLYFEVDYFRSIDIVVLHGNISMAIEVKSTFNFKVLEQSIENSKHFNYSYIAVPIFNEWSFQKKLCRDYGVGLLCYEHNEYDIITEEVKPKFNRHTNNTKLKGVLNDRHKQSLPGSKSGDSTKITAFQVTVENAVRYVMRHPGCTLKEMIDGIYHHYTNSTLASRNLYQWIHNGVIDELILMPGNKVYLSDKSIERNK
jgi:hypothetical protein